MINAYDDLFRSDKNAHAKTATDLKGWFKTKTGAGEAVAEKMATTFKALASYANFSEGSPASITPKVADASDVSPDVKADLPRKESKRNLDVSIPIGLTYRIEVHLPDTTNVETFRAIFRAIREELTT